MKALYEDQTLITFDQADPQGILFYAQAFNMAHKALEKFMKKTRLGWEFWFKNPEFAVPIKSAHADFSAPIRVGQLVNEVLICEKVSDSSVVLNYQLLSVGEDSKVCLQVQTVHVFVDQKRFQKTRVPDQIRDLLV